MALIKRQKPKTVHKTILRCTNTIVCLVFVSRKAAKPQSSDYKHSNYLSYYKLVFMIYLPVPQADL